MKFFTLIADNLGDAFLPLLPNVYNLAMNCAKMSVEIHYEEKENFVDKGKNYTEINIDAKIHGGKKVLSINHSSLAV